MTVKISHDFSAQTLRQWKGKVAQYNLGFCFKQF